MTYILALIVTFLAEGYSVNVSMTFPNEEMCRQHLLEWSDEDPQEIKITVLRECEAKPFPPDHPPEDEQ